MSLDEKSAMRVALLSEVFAKDMGYIENLLPKYLARLGVEIHVITTDLPTYYRDEQAREAYKGFIAQVQPGTVEQHNGFTLHVLGHQEVLGHMRMSGLRRKLRAIRPDIVQTIAAIGWIPLEAALIQPFLGYKLFTGCHTTVSVFPLAKDQAARWSRERLKCLFLRGVPGFLSNAFAEKCYAATSDCADVAVRFFGVPKAKIEVCPLGIDTELFSPISNDKEQKERLELRQRLGFGESEIVCVYSGRFSEDKNPLLLAKAISCLVGMGEAFRGLFVGNGAQRQEIEACRGCEVHPFVPVQELAGFLRAADIGVWPTQESMSMLDAAACGLPIVVNDTLAATERVEGNGLRYALNDLDDLVRVLRTLKDPQFRRHLGQFGADKMARQFSWESIAKRRLRDYRVALHAVQASRPEQLSNPGIEKQN